MAPTLTFEQVGQKNVRKEKKPLTDVIKHFYKLQRFDAGRTT
jgi:hypothetical protein